MIPPEKDEMKCVFSSTEGATVGRVYKTKWLGHLGMAGVQINDGTYVPIKMINAIYTEEKSK